MNVTGNIKKSDEHYGQLRNLYECICDCGNIKWLPQSIANVRVYCTQKCSARPSSLVTLNCAQCGNSFKRIPSHLKYSKSGLYFCNKECQSQAQRINGIKEIIPSHYGTKIKNSNCLYCNKLLTNKMTKYCSRNCQSNYNYKTYIRQWLNKEISGNEGISIIKPSPYIKKYLIEIYGDKCQVCGWKERHPITGNIPIQMDHIDGNSENNSLKNLQLLCPNHHSLTLNYGSLNIGNGRKHRRKMNLDEVAKSLTQLAAT